MHERARARARTHTHTQHTRTHTHTHTHAHTHARTHARRERERERERERIPVAAGQINTYLTVCLSKYTRNVGVGSVILFTFLHFLWLFSSIVPLFSSLLGCLTVCACFHACLFVYLLPFFVLCFVCLIVIPFRLFVSPVGWSLSMFCLLVCVIVTFILFF